MPRLVRFGSGVVEDLAQHLRLLSEGEVCVLTDAGVAGAGLVEPVSGIIESAGLSVDVVEGVETQPTIAGIEEAVDRVRERRVSAIVAVGGGSVADAAKITALLGTNGASVRDVIRWFGQGFADERALRPPLPLFTVPTMVSGADVVSAAVVTDPDAHTKFACWSLAMMPYGTFFDPANTTSSPRDHLVDAALDSFTHALEGLTGQTGTPITRNLALDAASRIFRSLPRLDSDWADDSAREDLCIGCLEAGLVVGNTRAAAIHGLSYPISSAFPISHGRSNILLAPTVVRYNGPAVAREYEELADALGLGRAVGDPTEAVARAIIELTRALELPTCLSEVGVTPERIPELVDAARRNSWFFRDVNARPVPDEDLGRLYAEALGERPCA
jgi:alcohol dehydrogenase class IV